MKRFLLALVAAGLLFTGVEAMAQDAGTVFLNDAADMSGGDCKTLYSRDRVCYYRFTTTTHSATFTVATGVVVHVKLDTDIASANDSTAEIKIHVVVSGATNVGSYVPSDATLDDTANQKTYVLRSGTYYIEVSSDHGSGETGLVKLEVVTES